MKTITKDELAAKVRAHAEWLQNSSNGERLSLTGYNLRGSNLSGSNLSGSNLRGSNLSGSDLSGSNLSDSNLSDSDLRGSDLRGSNLRGSNLSGSNLSGSNLSGSNLSGSDLSDSNLRGSNLSGSNLSGSDLRGSNLRGSNLASAFLHRTTGVLYAAANVANHDGGYMMNIWLAGDRTMLGCGCLFIDITDGIEEVEEHIQEKESAPVCREVLAFCLSQINRQKGK